MGIGETLKAQVDGARDALGTDCTLNGTTALGKCAYEDLSPSRARSSLGPDYEDELDLPWALIEAPAGSGIKEGDRITVDLTGRSWTVRRVMMAQAAGVLIAERCLCAGQLL